MGIFVADMFFAFGAAAVSLVIPAGSTLHYIRGGILGKQPGTAYDCAIGCIHAGTDRGPVLLQLFYFKLRACHGSQDRIRYACGDLFSLPEAVFPVLR